MADLGLLFDPALHQALSNLDVALEWSRAGVPVFPCYASGEKVKCPLRGVFWHSAATTNERQIRTWWEQNPDALPALHLGRADLLVIDADGEGGVADWYAVLDGRDDDAPTVETPSGGEHRYFRRGGRDLGNGRGSLPPKRGKIGIDVRGKGGYVIAPGATLLDGRRYEANGYDILSAPEIPDWLVEILQGQHEVQENRAARIEPGAPVSDVRRRAYGERALEAEMRELAMAAPGTRNETANLCAFRIGQLVGGGCLTEQEAYAALHNAAASWGIPANDKALGQRGTIARALRDGARSPRYCPEEVPDTRGAEAAAALLARQVQREPDGTLIDAETGEVIETADHAIDDDPIGGDYDFGDIARPDGLLGDITDWIVGTSRKPNRPLAMTAAISVLAGICSRHLMGPTGSATHLFLVNLGATSVGKDRPFKAVGQLLKASGYGCILQSGKFMSGSAIELTLKTSRTAVATVDEIGSAIFAKMSSRKATTHENAISSVLRELWSVLPGDDWHTFAKAGAAGEYLASPALTLMGASTLNEFYRSITGASVDNGFLNRFTVIMADPPAEERDELLNRLVVPPSLSQRLASILPNAGNLQALTALVGEEHPADIYKVRWAAPEVEAMHLSLARRIAHWRDDDDEASPYLGRTAEMAIRLATIHAVSAMGRRAVVTERDYRWGASVALASARFMIREASARMAETEFQANQKLVLAYIRDVREAKRSDITRKIDGRWEPAITDRILRSLCEGGQVVLEKGGSTASGGRKPDVYAYVRPSRKSKNGAPV
ncbi:bifunctional DNA primase/polymerase [Methylorubrum sp. B1-46]|uniref:bifunctional DNA primase/polymerase n=1 Tax=Methylorubrum sp. B1-46 TaxID=2897334 RepID=UPI001E292C99|nr:bifunctional DNA primase/polymerase [Methylorubrum sp. B1-46]UGB26372.1 bifunctional DNA primase/polymerase [Methylorubrum sp. B1-46]